jgi:hypothetical protein
MQHVPRGNGLEVANYGKRCFYPTYPNEREQYTIVILVDRGRVHIMDDISDDTKVPRRHAEIMSVVRRR